MKNILKIFDLNLIKNINLYIFFLRILEKFLLLMLFYFIFFIIFMYFISYYTSLIYNEGDIVFNNMHTIQFSHYLKYCINFIFYYLFELNIFVNYHNELEYNLFLYKCELLYNDLKIDFKIIKNEFKFYDGYEGFLWAYLYNFTEVPCRLGTLYIVIPLSILAMAILEPMMIEYNIAIFAIINNFNLPLKFINIINYIYEFLYYIKLQYNFNLIILLQSIYNSLNIIISFIFILPILNIFILFIKKNFKHLSLNFIVIKLNLILLFFFFLNIFDLNTNIFFTLNLSLFFNINFTFGIDFISLSFILLSDLLHLICLLLIWFNIKYKKKSYEILLILCNLLLFLIFIATDLFIFYIFFELILIPMFFLISKWGSRLRKIHASFQFFIYTIIGSLLFLFGLIYLNINYQTTDLLILKYLIISMKDQILLFLTFFLAFAIKVPIYPFHLWLPEAHVEAPTAGSVLLAGILLKLGTYGFLKFFFYLLPYGFLYFLPLINMLCLCGILFSSFTILRQIDIKKIIAYSSVIHMNYTILGLFNYSFYGFYGSFFLMLSHGIISSALFICIGYIYERYHTRLIFYYGNLVMIMPLLSVFFFLFTLGNVGFPGTSSFIGEFLIFLGLVQSNILIAIFTLFGLFISVIYSFLLYNKVFFFNALNKKNFILHYTDLNKREFVILFILICFMFFYGIYTKSFFNTHYYILNDLYLNSKYFYFY